MSNLSDTKRRLLERWNNPQYSKPALRRIDIGGGSGLRCLNNFSIEFRYPIFQMTPTQLDLIILLEIFLYFHLLILVLRILKLLGTIQEKGILQNTLQLKNQNGLTMIIDQ